MLTDVVIANKGYTKLNLSEDCRMDSIALHVIREDCPDFILPMRMMEIDGEREIRYELQEGIRLSYMPTRMSKKNFISIMINMLIPFQTCNDWFLDYHNFLLDENYVLVQTKEQSVKYIYIPSAEYANSDEKIKEFFSNIMLKMDLGEESGYLVNVLRIIKSQDSNLTTLLEFFQKETAEAADSAKPLPNPAPDRPKSDEAEKKPEKKLEKKPLPLPVKLKNQKPEIFDAAEEEPSKSVQSEKEFGKKDEEGRLIDNLFGDSEEPEKEKEQKNRKLFGWMKGKPKDEKKEKQKPEKKTGKRASLFDSIKHEKERAESVQSVQKEENHQPDESNSDMETVLLNENTAFQKTDDNTTFQDEREESHDYNILRLRLEDYAGCQCPELIEINLQSGSATVGRRNKNGELQSDFNFDAAISFISRRHFRVEKKEDCWNIIDLKSGNGTFVNQNKLVPNIPYPLNYNDVIMISCNRQRVVYRVC